MQALLLTLAMTLIPYQASSQMPTNVDSQKIVEMNANKNCVSAAPLDSIHFSIPKSKLHSGEFHDFGVKFKRQNATGDEKSLTAVESDSQLNPINFTLKLPADTMPGKWIFSDLDLGPGGIQKDLRIPFHATSQFNRMCFIVTNASSTAK